MDVLILNRYYYYYYYYYSTSEKLGNIWRNEQDGISTIEVEAEQRERAFKWRFRSRRRRCCLSSLLLCTLIQEYPNN